jgi:dCMP deaminase
MREVKSWGHYFMDMAHMASTRSKDPNTNVGAVLVDNNRSIIETGYNGFAPGLKENEERWQRPTKYAYVIHAEQNAIGRAARAGKRLDGATLFCTHLPCKECAKMILASGIRNVVADLGQTAMTSIEDRQFVEALFHEAGVNLSYLSKSE